MLHELAVERRRISIISQGCVICGSYGVDEVAISLDDEWAYMDSVWVIFTGGSGRDTRSVRVPYSYKITIPWECLTREGYLYITCVGYVKDEKRLITQDMSAPIVIKGAGRIQGCKPLAPTTDELTGVIEAAAKAAAELIADGGFGFVPISDTEIDEICKQP